MGMDFSSGASLQNSQNTLQCNEIPKFQLQKRHLYFFENLGVRSFHKVPDLAAFLLVKN